MTTAEGAAPRDTHLPGINRGIYLAVMLTAGVGIARAGDQSLDEWLQGERSRYERFAGNGPWVLKERIWLPAAPDALTRALYPLDRPDSTEEVESLLTEAAARSDDDVAGVTALLQSDADGEGGLVLRDAGTSGPKRPARGVGECAFVTNGVFGGALRLAGGASAIILPNYSLDRAFTVQAWFCPEKLGGTLMHLAGAGGAQEAVVKLLSDGTVALFRERKQVGVSERRMAPGVFTHLAFVARSQFAYISHAESPRDSLLYMDGRLQIRGGAMASLGTPLRVGNSPAGDAPLIGLVDDLRVSRGARDFYAYGDADSDPLAQRPVSRDPPVMRGRDELLLDAPLDGTTAAEGPFRGGFVPPSATNRYVSARRGRGVLVDPKVSLRFEPAEPLPVGQGSLEFWFTPADWDNNQPYPEGGPQHKIPVFRLLTSSESQTNVATFLSLSLDQTSETKGFLMPYYAHPLNPGTWRHAVITWRGHEVRVFINGKEHVEPLPSHPIYGAAANRGLSPSKLRMVALEFGGPSPGGGVMIDEVKLYKHRLTPMEIVNAYQRFLVSGTIEPLPPIDLQVSMNHPLHNLVLTVDLLMPERDRIASFDVEMVRTTGSNEVVLAQTNVTLDAGNRVLQQTHAGIIYGDYRVKFAFKDEAGNLVRALEISHSYPRPAWVDNTLGIHDGEVMPPWTPMEYRDGVVSCWGREMTIGGAGWPTRIVSQGRTIMPQTPDIRLVTDRGEIRLDPVGAQPRVLKQQPGALETEGTARGGSWTMTTTLRTEFDGFMKLRTLVAGPTNAEVRELRIRFPLQFAAEQFYGFYTGEHWFRSAHDFRLLPKGEGIVFASNKTGRRHPQGWAGNVSFLPYVTVGDDWRQLVWLCENDRNWTQSWTNPAVTISRDGEMTWLNLNIIQAPRQVKEPLAYAFGLQATPIRPMEPDSRTVQNGFSFGQVCGFNGHYMPARFEGHFSFRLSPKDLDWDYSMEAARAYRGGDVRNPKRPLLMYLDRTWQRAPEDALEYNRDWRGWGDAVRYTKPVRDCYAWYVNEWIRRGIMDGMYIDDAWIDPTKSLWHLDPKDNLAYRKDSGRSEDFSDREWGYEFFDYREMLKRIRWLFHDNQIRPMIVTHVTQTPYYPVFGFVDIMLEGEDKYLSDQRSSRDFIDSWGMPRLRYANPQKWGVPVQWLPVLSVQKLRTTGMPMQRWYFQQHRAYLGCLLVNDVSAPNDGEGGLYRKEIRAAGGYSDPASFIGYWDPQNPVTASTSNCYVSVYQLPGHLTLVLLNAGPREEVADFAVDPARMKALLGTDSFLIQDVDTATIPPLDKEYAELLKGVTVKTQGTDVSLVGGEEDDLANELAETLTEEVEARERKEADPDGFFEYHNFRCENNVLRLRIQRHDYRLLKLTPK